MIEGLFLDRVHCPGNQFAVVVRHELALAVKPAFTDALLVHAEAAVERTQVTDYPIIGTLFIICGRLYHDLSLSLYILRPREDYQKR